MLIETNIRRNYFLALFMTDGVDRAMKTLKDRLAVDLDAIPSVALLVQLLRTVWK